MKNSLKKVLFYCAAWTVPEASCYASNAGPSMPWDTPLQVVQNALSGSIAHAIVIISIALSGFGFAFGEHGGALKKIMGVVFGGAISIGAVSIYNTLSFSGALIA